MLRHTGEKRSYRHNIRLAILLSANAGFINAAGFLAFNVLTTNVTGHAALLALYLAAHNLRSARMVALWLVLFLLGAFSSALYIARMGRDKRYTYAVLVLVIASILFAVASSGWWYDHSLPRTEILAGALLLAMGMQNAMVSMISGAVVRTTHLTGLVTDLGIDLAHWIAGQGRVLPSLRQHIILRASIAGCFLAGGVVGGITFSSIGFAAFYISVGLLVFTLFYDYLRIRLSRALHK